MPGHEAILMLASDDYRGTLVGGFDSENYTIPLNFTAYPSRMFAHAPGMHEILATRPVTMNNHQAGVTPATMQSNAKLSAMFNVISTNLDRRGRQFVSTTEHKTLPITTTQWHPEKAIYEWDPNEVINHSTHSVVANGYTALYFVSQARQNARSFANAAELAKLLIYNYQPVFTNGEFNQRYIFA
jgi:gamma-glutamyl hydrolase